MSTKIIERGGPSSYLSRFLPILSWLPHYSREWLPVDILAGLTLWGLLAPEAMAYAGIAGLPPQTGLYTLLASLLVYALFGTSRHLSVGPTSATAALIGSTILALGVSPSDMDSYQAYAFMLVLVVGVVFLAAGFARLGFITQFLSKPVMDGFVMGLAIFVAVGQLHKLFGVEKGEGNTLVKLLSILRQLAEANWITFAIGVIALALLFLLPRLSKRIPAGLVVLFGFILLGSVLNLSERFGVEVIGKLPQGLPALAIPWLPPTKILGMILPAIGIVLVAYSEALGVAREFAEKHGYKVDPDQELTAQGFTNLVSSLFGGMIAAGGMSGSAVKEGAGARTQVSNLVAWVAVVVTVLFLTPLFTYLPEAVLGALIIHAVWHLIAARKLRQIRLVSRSEFFLGVLTLAGVLLWDVLPGMVIGLLASLLHFIYITSRPHIAFLGRNPDLPEVYSDIERHPENIPVPGLLIVRFDAPLFYANAQTFSELVLEKVNKDQPKAVLLDAVVQDRLDLTSAEVLMGLVRELHSKGVAVYTAEVHRPVREFSQRTGLLDLIGEDRTFPTIDTAVRFIETSAEWASNNK